MPLTNYQWYESIARAVLQGLLQSSCRIRAHGYWHWTITKRLEEKLNGTYTRVLIIVLSKPWHEHPELGEWYGNNHQIGDATGRRRPAFACHCRCSDDEFACELSRWSPKHGLDMFQMVNPEKTRIRQFSYEVGKTIDELSIAIGYREVKETRDDLIRTARPNRLCSSKDLF